MRRRPLSRLLPTLVLVAACTTPPDTGILVAEAYADDEMMSYCRAQAAAAFRVPEEEIVARPAIEDRDGFTVTGQIPPQGPGAAGFACRFDASGAYLGLTRS
jgi:hypothetical protein